jgi:hypothetical protein
MKHIKKSGKYANLSVGKNLFLKNVLFLTTIFIEDIFVIMLKTETFEFNNLFLTMNREILNYND